MIKWVARLAVITALLGLAGSIIIISNMPAKQKADKKVVAENQHTPPVSTPALDSVVVKTQPKKTIPLPPSTPGVIVEKKEPPAPVVIPAPKKVVEKPAKPVAEKKETIKKSAPLPPVKTEKPKPAKEEQDEKLFSAEELQQLVSRIEGVKEEQHIHSNCVQIYTTSQSNYRRTVEQVEMYLKSRQFSIAGREVLETKVKGILISPKAGCIRITIGTF